MNTNPSESTQVLRRLTGPLEKPQTAAPRECFPRRRCGLGSQAGSPAWTANTGHHRSCFHTPEGSYWFSGNPPFGGTPYSAAL